MIIPIGSYSVIYTADWNPDRARVNDFAPPHCKRLWDLTEGDSEADYASIGLKRHRKWCALLTPAQFIEFVDHCYLTAETTETMGSLGTPGYGLSLAPAISFEGSDDSDGISNAYVTPTPVGDPSDYEPSLRPEQLSMVPMTDAEIAAVHERLWQQVRTQVLEEFE